MSAKITVGGVEITVDTAELGEALRQLGPWLAPPKKEAAAAPMPKKGAWPFPTGEATPDTPPPTAPIKTAPQASAHIQAEIPVIEARRQERSMRGEPLPVERAISLFKAVRDHRTSGGLLPQEVMQLVGVSHPKGTGSRMQGINRILRELGFNDDDVYRNDRGPLGDRVWTPGDRIDEAIEELEKRTLA